jgi:hypothetical protein
MSFDVDMQSYGRSDAPAAGAQVVDTNSYGQEEGVAVHQELLDQPEQKAADEVLEKPTDNPQAENFRALREEVDRIKAEREAEKQEYQLQLDMLRANVNSQPKQSPPEPQPKQMFDGMKDDDIPSVAEIRKEWMQREADYQSRLEELQVQQSHPDYAEVIEKFALPLVKQKPHLIQGIQNSSNKALFAYELGKMAQQIHSYQQPVQTKSENAQKIVENSRKPGTLSQAGGQGALSKADYFASMSDAEFMKMASRNLEGI